MLVGAARSGMLWWFVADIVSPASWSRHSVRPLVSTPKVLALLCLVASCSCVAAHGATPPGGSGPPQDRFSQVLIFRGGNNWQLSVENTNVKGFIDSFNWLPPLGLTITAIKSSKGGTCTMSSGGLICSTTLAPEPCSSCDGGAMTVSFAGTGLPTRTFVNTSYGGYWVNAGWSPGDANVTSMSASASFPDLPHCAKGQASTKLKPCAKS